MLQQQVRAQRGRQFLATIFAAFNPRLLSCTACVRRRAAPATRLPRKISCWRCSLQPCKQKKRPGFLEARPSRFAIYLAKLTAVAAATAITGHFNLLLHHVANLHLDLVL